MTDNFFTLEELQTLNVEDLKNVCTYLGLPFKAKSKKQDLIGKIVAYDRMLHMPPGFSIDEETHKPKMSVRLQRIYERNGGKLP